MKYYKVDEITVEALEEYLKTKPYEEVSHLVPLLYNLEQVKQIENSPAPQVEHITGLDLTILPTMPEPHDN